MGFFQQITQAFFLKPQTQSTSIFQETKVLHCMVIEKSLKQSCFPFSDKKNPPRNMKW